MGMTQTWEEQDVVSPLERTASMREPRQKSRHSRSSKEENISSRAGQGT